MSHQDGSDNSNLSPKGYECFKVIFISSSNPHHKSYNPRNTYKCRGIFLNVGSFDYLWEMYPCTFCNAAHHCGCNYEQHKVMVKRVDFHQTWRTSCEFEDFLLNGQVKVIFLPIVTWMGWKWKVLETSSRTLFQEG